MATSSERRLIRAGQATGMVLQVSFSPDGKLLAAATGNGIQ
jgi:hypothetical protein